MRTFVVSLVLVGCATVAAAEPATNNESAASPSASTVAVQQVRAPLPGLRDEVAMVLVGTVLIGLAAAVRRAA